MRDCVLCFYYNCDGVNIPLIYLRWSIQFSTPTYKHLPTPMYVILQLQHHQVCLWTSDHLLCKQPHFKLISTAFFWTTSECLYLCWICLRSSRFSDVQSICLVIPAGIKYKSIYILHSYMWVVQGLCTHSNNTGYLEPRPSCMEGGLSVRLQHQELTIQCMHNSGVKQVSIQCKLRQVC